MKRTLTGATVVITGASSGIGRAAALAFARKGANVVVTARRQEPLHELAAEIGRLGVGSLDHPADVNDVGQLEAVAQRAEADFGRIDVWVNNAGVYLAGKFEETPPEAFRQVIETNFFGCVNGARVALPRLRASQGALINTASVDAAVTFPYFSAYVASKWALRGWTSALRQELRGQGVDVCAVLPATIDTPLFEHVANYTGWAIKTMNPVYSPEMVAEAMVRCAEHGTREAWVGGIGKLLALQYSLLPGLTERFLAGHVERDHFRRHEPAPSTAGNLFDPVQQGTGTAGGWGGSRMPDFIGAGFAGAALLGSAAAWLSRRRRRSLAGRLKERARELVEAA